MSAPIGFVLYSCHDFSCLMTDSRFYFFVIIEVSFLLWFGEKGFELLFSKRGILSSGSCNLNILLIVLFWCNSRWVGRQIIGIR